MANKLVIAAVTLTIGAAVLVFLNEDKCQRLGYDRLIDRATTTVLTDGSTIHVRGASCQYTAYSKDVSMTYIVPVEDARERITSIKAGEAVQLTMGEPHGK